MSHTTHTRPTVKAAPSPPVATATCSPSREPWRRRCVSPRPDLRTCSSTRRSRSLRWVVDPTVAGTSMLRLDCHAPDWCLESLPPPTPPPAPRGTTEPLHGEGARVRESACGSRANSNFRYRPSAGSANNSPPAACLRFRPTSISARRARLTPTGSASPASVNRRRSRAQPNLRAGVDRCWVEALLVPLMAASGRLVFAPLRSAAANRAHPGLRAVVIGSFPRLGGPRERGAGGAQAR